MIKFQGLYLSAIKSYIPQQTITNDDLINREGLKMKASWIEKNLGITTRRWASPEEAASDLAAKSCQEMDLKNFQGSIWLSTISPDYLTPSTSSIFKKKIGIKGDHPAYDTSAACAGFLFALEAAATRLTSSVEIEALVSASEVRSRYLNPKDRRTVFLFGDAAATAHLTKKRPAGKYFSLSWTHTGTIPTEHMEILVPGGGSAKPLNQEAIENGEQFIQMVDGNSIVESTQEYLVSTIKKVLGSDRSPEDYDLILFHQGNKRLILTILERLGMGEDKTHITFSEWGNSSSASVAVTLVDAMEKKTLKDQAKVLLVAFGAGQHLGLTELVWNK